MILIFIAVLFLSNWFITLYNGGIIGQTGLLMNNKLTKTATYNKVMQWTNGILAILTIVLLIVNLIIPHNVIFIIIRNIFIFVSIIFVPLTALSLNYVTNKFFKTIRYLIALIILLFTITLVAFPFVAGPMQLKPNDIMIINYTLSLIDLLLMIALFAYNIFLMNETSLLDKKIKLMQKYHHNSPNYKVTNAIKNNKRNLYKFPIIFSKDRIKTIYKSDFYDLLTIKINALPSLKNDVNDNKNKKVSLSFENFKNKINNKKIKKQIDKKK